MPPEFSNTSAHMSGKLNWPTTKSMLTDIHEFHSKFGLPASPKPQQLSHAEAEFRYDFMKEELEEFRIAFSMGDLHDQFDALIDLAYVTLGTAYSMGLPFQKGWDIVHAANMTKVRGPSKRSGEFDVIKPPGFVKPDLNHLLK